MGRPFKNRIGEKFGMLTIIGRGKGYKRICECECGTIKEIQMSHLKSGGVSSCGCKRVSKTKDCASTFNSYNSMVQRCNNPNNTSYYKYGAAGITICGRWNPDAGGSFQNFLEDMGEKPLKHSLNRINSCLVYSKDTCEWASDTIQSFDQKIDPRNTTGVSGVRYRQDKGKYEARISKDSKQYILYFGNSLIEAIESRLIAELKHYPKECNRKFTYYLKSLEKQLSRVEYSKILEILNSATSTN